MKCFKFAGFIWQFAKSDSDGWEITQMNGHKHKMFFAVSKVTSLSNLHAYNVVLGDYVMRLGRLNQRHGLR